MKYNVGDKVRVRSDLSEGQEYNSVYVTADMASLAGTVVTIAPHWSDCRYSVREDPGCWAWIDEMFEGLAEDEVMFKVKCVRVRSNPEFFTEGKVYEVVNGVIVSDNNTDFGTWSNPLCGEGHGNTFESLRRWFSRWYDFELVEDELVEDTTEDNTEGNKMFTKNDLKTGMFGVMDNGWMFVVVNDTLVYQNDGWDNISSMGDNLEYSDWKIKKVYTGVCSFNMLENILNGSSSTLPTLVYDRERDTKKPLYNGKVVCIDNCHNKNNYTPGKIYEFKDGVMTCDSGHTFGLNTPFESFEDWKNYTSAKFIEAVV